MKKLLLFSVVLLTYTLGNAQNGTQTNKSTSSASSTSLNARKEVSSVSRTNKSEKQLDNRNAIKLNNQSSRVNETSRIQLKSNDKNNNVQPLERK